MSDELYDIITNAIAPKSFLNSAFKQAPTYPPFNIIQISENELVHEYALAGFSKNEIRVDVTGALLNISAKRENADIAKYLYKGIGARSFEKRISLTDGSKVTKADFVDGILSIHIEQSTRNPARTEITIGSDSRQYLTERQDII